MVKHVILWKLFDELSDSEKAEVKKNIKEGLESLKGKIEGLEYIKVEISPLESSNCDLMLDSAFVSADALKYYAGHPEHVKVANERVRPYTSVRMCMDYEA